MGLRLYQKADPSYISESTYSISIMIPEGYRAIVIRRKVEGLS